MKPLLSMRATVRAAPKARASWQEIMLLFSQGVTAMKRSHAGFAQVGRREAAPLHGHYIIACVEVGQMLAVLPYQEHILILER